MSVWETLAALGVEAVFDGPGERCPVCRGIVEQLTLDFEFESDIPASCGDCGAVLAA